MKRLAFLDYDILVSKNACGDIIEYDLTLIGDRLKENEKQFYLLSKDTQKRVKATSFFMPLLWIRSFGYQGLDIAKEKHKDNLAIFMGLYKNVQSRMVEKKLVYFSSDKRQELGIPRRRQYLDIDDTLKDCVESPKKDEPQLLRKKKALIVVDKYLAYSREWLKQH